MKKEDAVSHFGGKSNLARALGIDPASVSQWGDFIPKGRAYELQALTGNKLKYEPKPQELKQAS